MAEGGGGKLGGFPTPQVNFPGDPFLGKQPYGYGVGFPGVFGIGSKGVQVGPFTFGFSGPSPKAKTTSVGDKLIANKDPVLKKLGFQLLNAEKSGIYTSSSNPAAQKVLSGYFDEAVHGLQQQFGFSQKQAAKYVSDLISTSATGAALSKDYVKLVAAQAAGPPPPPTVPTTPSQPIPPTVPVPTPMPIPPAPTPTPGRLPTAPHQVPINPIMGFPQSTLGTPSFFNQAAQFALPVTGAFVGGAIGGVVGEAVPLFGPQLGAAAGEYFGEQFGQQLANRYFPVGGQSGGTTPQIPTDQRGIPPGGGGQPTFQPPTVPILQPCPECGYNPAPVIAAQQGQLQQEIQREQAQQTIQTLQQTQQELDRLQQLEQQPVSMRNIQQELQQKQQIQQTLQQLQQGQQPGPGPQVGQNSPNGPLAPLLDYQTPLQPPAPGSSAGGGQPTFLPAQAQGSEPTAPPVGFQQGTPGPDGVPHPLAPGQVKFCVVCSSQNESLKFLNGEPSECSVLTQ